MAIKTWRRGRSGICSEGKTERFSFQICPLIKKELNDFCTQTGLLKSVIINEAILAYIKKNKGE